MRHAIPLIAAAFLATACNGFSGGEGEAGEGGASRDFAVGQFSRVTLAGPDEVVVTKGPLSVKAEGTDEVLGKLDIKVEGDRLVVGRVPNSGATVVNPINWKGKGRAKVLVSVPTPLTGADLSGAGRFTLDGVAGPDFEATISGAGSLGVSGLAADRVRLDVSGAGGATLEGRTKLLGIGMSGAGGVKAEGLEATDLSVDLSGVGSVKARATGKVTGSVSGVGSVRVTGTADCNIDKSGVGSVKCGM